MAKLDLPQPQELHILKPQPWGLTLDSDTCRELNSPQLPQIRDFFSAWYHIHTLLSADFTIFRLGMYHTPYTAPFGSEGADSSAEQAN